MLGEAAAGHATRQRQPQLRTVSPGDKMSHFRKDICNHKPKPNEDAEQDNHFRAHRWVRGESDKGSLGDNLQNVYYKIQYRLAKCFPMFSDTYTG